MDSVANKRFPSFASFLREPTTFPGSLEVTKAVFISLILPQRTRSVQIEKQDHIFFCGLWGQYFTFRMDQAFPDAKGQSDSYGYSYRLPRDKIRHKNPNRDDELEP